MDILDQLTDAQREAVTHGAGPLLVVAGAGSGKTRVITRRVAYLATNGVPPYRILAITFTNKAADEMRRRVEDVSGIRGPWISTFHSMCARMLRQFQDLLGFAHPFTIYDRADSLACLKVVLREFHLGGTKARPEPFLAAISGAKNEMLTAEMYGERARTEYERRAARVYESYERACRAHCALDFDDLLLRAAQLLSDDERFRSYWQARFEHVLIDEYQDTNRPQYVIVKRLVEGHRNVCATGDPDQSIYTWRGADIRNILDFQKDYPDARVVKLEENFRSTKQILAGASGVIEHNKARIERGLWTQNEEGGRISVVRSATDIDEAGAILAGIRAAVGDGFTHGDAAVFYRTHAQSRVIEDALRDGGVPYMILDAVEFYNRKEIKNVVAYLKAILNPADAVSLLRIINEPRRGIGSRTEERLAAHAATRGLTIEEAIASAAGEPEVAGRSGAALRKFAELMARLRALPRAPVAPLVRGVLRRTRYLAELKRSGSEEDLARAQNVEELVNAAAEFDLEYPDAGLETFLERVTLVADSDAMTGEGGTVLLMTLHSAKGLEFPAVFIAGVQEGLLPHLNSLGSPTKVEEERRLCYVGMTRAKRRLSLHWASERFTYGMLGTASASRFINEIPRQAREHVAGFAEEEEEEEAAQAEHLPHGRQECLPHRSARVLKAGTERVIEYEPEMVGYGGVELGAGDVVRHATFGVGRVLSVSGDGGSARADVDFRGRRRRLILQFANLRKVR